MKTWIQRIFLGSFLACALALPAAAQDFVVSDWAYWVQPDGLGSKFCKTNYRSANELSNAWVSAFWAFKEDTQTPIEQPDYVEFQLRLRCHQNEDHSGAYLQHQQDWPLGPFDTEKRIDCPDDFRWGHRPAVRVRSNAYRSFTYGDGQSAD